MPVQRLIDDVGFRTDPADKIPYGVKRDGPPLVLQLGSQIAARLGTHGMARLRWHAGLNHETGMHPDRPRVVVVGDHRDKPVDSRAPVYCGQCPTLRPFSARCIGRSRCHKQRSPIRGYVPALRTARSRRDCCPQQDVSSSVPPRMTGFHAFDSPRRCFRIHGTASDPSTPCASASASSQRSGCPARDSRGLFEDHNCRKCGALSATPALDGAS